MDSLYLVHHGVPFDVAFSLDQRERLAWVVIIGTMQGRQFDWKTEQWLSPE